MISDKEVQLAGLAHTPVGDVVDSEQFRRSPKLSYSQCPVCGYWAFNGVECFDCGYARAVLKLSDEELAEFSEWLKKCPEREDRV